jgi:hypothetical protein
MERQNRPTLETLESRQMFAVFSGINGGQLQVTETSAVDTITLDHVNGNTIVNGASYADAAITNGIKITAGTGVGNFDTIKILATVKKVTIDGQHDIGKLLVGKNGLTQDVNASITVSNFNGDDDGELVIDDSANPFARTANMSVNADGLASITGLSPGGVVFDEDGVIKMTLRGGSGGNTFNINDTPNGGSFGLGWVVVQAGSGNDTVNVKKTSEGSAVEINGGGGRDAVTYGANGSVQNLRGDEVRAYSSNSGKIDLTIDDSLDATSRDVLVDHTFDPDFGFMDYSNLYVRGLAPAKLIYGAVDMATVNIKGGVAGNKFTWDDRNRASAFFQTTLNTGTGKDDTAIFATSDILTVNGQNSRDRVTIGSATPFEGGLTLGIKKDVTLTNTFSFTSLYLNDSSDSTARNGFADQPNAAFTRVGGLSSGSVWYNVNDTDLVSVNLGNGSDTFNVRGAAGPKFSLFGGAGNDVINVGSAFNTLDPIKAPLDLHGGGGFNTLSINDQGSTLAHIYTVTPTSVTRTFNSPTVTINFDPFQALVLNRGPAISSPPLVKDLTFTSSIHAGEKATLTGHLFDSDGDTNLSLVIDWGDGSKPTGVSAGVEPFSEQHKFHKAGTYTVRAIWTDTDGNSNFKDLTLTVLPKAGK